MNPRSTTLEASTLTYTTEEPTIYHTWGEHANYYTTDELTIYHTRGEHANHYTTDEPTIYHTWGEHANYYTTDVVCVLSVMLDSLPSSLTSIPFLTD